MYKRKQCYRNRNFITSDSQPVYEVLLKDICLWPPCIHKLEPYKIPQVIAQIPPPPNKCSNAY